ncbi:ER membrane protein complex subunit 3-like [Dysidea avara]|uniref:ER membrane protein complex subunit 3-like n=1 Tax=Dysidea avara TaxID=196820 RepID=UPI00331A18A5
MAELVLDPDIRLWVFLPIVFITLLFGIIRHYVSMLLHVDPKPGVEEIKDGQALLRTKHLRENGGYIPKQSFLMRRHFFNDEETGYFKTETRSVKTPLNAMDPSMAMTMVKGTLTNVLPMIVLGGWISWVFSGFIITKVPFPLTLRFKGMLQRGVQLTTLNASWVSSMSWYFLNVFGLRSVYSLILGQDNAADHTHKMAEQMSNPVLSGKQDTNKIFKEQSEALQVTKHHDLLANASEEMLRLQLPLIQDPRQVTSANKKTQ